MELIFEFYNMLRDSYAVVAGTGAYVILWIFSLYYCLFESKNGEDKCRIGAPILVVLIIITNPITGIVIFKCLDQYTYSRVAWCCMGIYVIAYAATQMMLRQSTKWKRNVFLVVCTVAIMLSGKLVYNPENFTMADNRMKLSDESVNIANYLVNNYPDETIAVDLDIVTEIRQYDASISLLYGREDYYHCVETAYTLGDDNFTNYLKGIQTEGCHVIVMDSANADFRQKMLDNGWQVVWSYNGYDVYHIEG